MIASSVGRTLHLTNDQKSEFSITGQLAMQRGESGMAQRSLGTQDFQIKSRKFCIPRKGMKPEDLPKGE